ncbi:MAG: hypothetical protein R3Y12_05410 [Clostridia bacterium]
MDKRKLLHEMLCEINQNINVYYQPPNNTQIKYPAIVYSRERIKNNFAGNAVYLQKYQYNIMVIDYNPDSLLVDLVSKLPTSQHKKHYVSDKLNHDVFTITY